MTIQSIEKIMGALLISGTVFAFLFVLAGGLAYLAQHGHEPVSLTLLSSSLPIPQTSWYYPLYFIDIGLFILAGTQLLRVMLMFFFYLWQRDYYFTAISLFITMVLIYSSCYPFLAN